MGRIGIAIAVGIALVGFVPSWAGAQRIDPHLVYEQRCAGCHAPHAIDFAQASLEKLEGGLFGKASRKPLDALLPRHRGTLQTPEEIAALVSLFEQNLASGALYRNKCIVCHDRARDFARLRLVIVDGELVGRYTGYRVKAFLTSHGRLTEQEVGKMLATLRWQVETKTP